MEIYQGWGFMRYIICAALLVLSPSVLAAYDVEVTLTAPTTGGPVDSYTLTLNGSDVGPLTVGVNSFPGLLPADGSYVFQARATNAAGSTTSDPVTITTQGILPPGQPGISIVVDCAPCIITTNP